MLLFFMSFKMQILHTIVQCNPSLPLVHGSVSGPWCQGGHLTVHSLSAEMQVTQFVRISSLST